MKRVLKIAGWIFLGMIVVGNLVRIIGKSAVENSFATQVAKANRNCPIPVGNGAGQISSIKLEDGYLVYNIDYTAQYFHLLSETNNQDEVKEILMMSILCLNGQGDGQGNVIINTLIDEGYGMKYVINSNAKGHCEYAVTVEEMKAMRRRYQQNPHEALYRVLKLQMELERSSLPLMVDEGLLMTDCSLENDNIVITMELDENLYSIADIMINSNEVKEAMLVEAINDPDSKTLLDLCKISHTGLIYKCVGKSSKEVCSISISSDEIRTRVKTPDSVDIN